MLGEPAALGGEPGGARQSNRTSSLERTPLGPTRGNLIGEICFKFLFILGCPGGSWAPLGDLFGIKNQVFFQEGPNIVPKKASGDI